MSLTFNIIGTGSVGKTIGRLLVKHQLAVLLGVFNRNAQSSLNGIQFIEDGTAYSTLCALPEVDIVLITTPDDVIGEVGLALLQNENIKPGCIIVHCSGSLTSDALLPLKRMGCYIVSIHPMRSFSEPALSVAQFSGTYCAIEGDIEAIEVITKLFHSIHAIVYPIHKDKKCMYHAAGVFASNYLVTLSNQALSCLEDAGVEKKMSMDLIINIMKGTVFNLEKTRSPENALTGPIQRGDVAAIENQLNAFQTMNQKELYASLGKATIELTHHSENIVNKLRELFAL
jgi:predicted short-subunit dehydrogenase-like oxidoreductase (DUF2520 family)